MGYRLKAKYIIQSVIVQLLLIGLASQADAQRIQSYWITSLSLKGKRKSLVKIEGFSHLSQSQDGLDGSKLPFGNLIAAYLESSGIELLNPKFESNPWSFNVPRPYLQSLARAIGKAQRELPIGIGYHRWQGFLETLRPRERELLEEKESLFLLMKDRALGVRGTRAGPFPSLKFELSGKMILGSEYSLEAVKEIASDTTTYQGKTSTLEEVDTHLWEEIKSEKQANPLPSGHFAQIILDDLIFQKLSLFPNGEKIIQDANIQSIVVTAQSEARFIELTQDSVRNVTATLEEGHQEGLISRLTDLVEEAPHLESIRIFGNGGVTLRFAESKVDQFLNALFIRKSSHLRSVQFNLKIDESFISRLVERLSTHPKSRKIAFSFVGLSETEARMWSKYVETGHGSPLLKKGSSPRFFHFSVWSLSPES